MDELKIILEDVVGKENVSDDDFERICYSRGANADIAREPLIIVRPKNKEQISEIVKTANRLKVPILSWGGASNVVGAFSRGCIVVDLTGLDKKIEIDEESLTVTATANVTWTQLLYELNKKGWTTGPLGHAAISATLGGAVALCGNGPHSARYGLVGDQITGVEAVLPSGEVVRTGSGAYPNAGNFIRYAWGSDLTGLFLGSHGIFGIVTEVSLKIDMLSEFSQSHPFEFSEIEKLARAIHNIQKRRMRTVEWIMYVLMGNIPIDEDTKYILGITLTGDKEEVDYSGKVVNQICSDGGTPGGFASMLVEEKTTGRVFFQGTKILGNHLMLMPLCSCIPPLRMPNLVKAYGEAIEKLQLRDYDILPAFNGHACQTTVVASPVLYYNQSDEKSHAKALEAAPIITERLAQEVGFTPHYVGRTKNTPESFWKLGAYYELLKSIKKALDPNNIMNPGQLFLANY